MWMKFRLAIQKVNPYHKEMLNQRRFILYTKDKNKFGEFGSGKHVQLHLFLLSLCNKTGQFRWK